ncbi:MAG: Gfo/Idh/MocA family oxidoreductase [Oscillospiraceae bacterium]|nr:Gfo/Idh/MocA family oxidoreductase [Oscillospiraceae bacterium]
MQKADGMNYAPESKNAVRVVAPDEFVFAAVGLSHGHIYAMCRGLCEAGATLKYVYEKDAALLSAFLKIYPDVSVAGSEKDILEDASVRLVASAEIPNLRAALGIRVLRSGKDFYSDKPGMTTFEQLEAVKAAVAASGRKYYVYFGERIHVESAIFAQRLIDEGKLGRVLQVTILAPHRLNKSTRPNWFWDPVQSGEILNDIGSHQFEQFLSYTGAQRASVTASRYANYANPEHPDFQDFGDVCLLADNGAAGYCRVDWFTPDGLGAWGDGRVFIMGEKATVEIRKYIDLANTNEGDHVLFTDALGEHRYDVYGTVGFPFFGEFILDCLHRTENSMTQEHVFEAMRLSLEAAQKAIRIGSMDHCPAL